MKEELKEILDAYAGAGRDQLIPLLQEVQDREGYLSRESVAQVAERLNLPASKVFGVATFYNQFRFNRPGRFHIQVCRGTACHVKGSAAVLAAVEQALGIKTGQTTRDGLFSLEVVACIGACSLAPVMSVGGEFHAAVAPDQVEGILQSYRRKAQDDDAAQ